MAEDCCVEIDVVEDVIDVSIDEETIDVAIVEEVLPIDEDPTDVAVALVEDVIAVSEGPDELDINIAEENLTVDMTEVLIVRREDEVPYAERVDFTNNDTVIYKGSASPGVINGEALWRIQRLSIAGDDDVVAEWADGQALFNQVWDDRLSLSYS